MHQNALAEQNIKLRFFSVEHPLLCECDLLIIDSKFFHGPKRGMADYVVARLEKWRTRQNNLLWFDTTDSAGWLFEGALSTAKAYYKNQILRDRSTYLKPMYGRRVPSDFYHSYARIIDSNADEAPQVRDPAMLDLLKISWNSGLANYSRYGPYFFDAYSLCKWNTLLNWPKHFRDPRAPRPVNVSCRFGVTYDRATVAHQRREIRHLLSGRISTRKIHRAAYVRELESSKIVISPFGLGEITLKDFEVFLSGALLLKPDMSHMETWPDYFIEDTTMKTFHWTLDNLEHQIEVLLDDNETRTRIAAAGQERYREQLNDELGQKAFVKHFLSITEHGLM